MKVLIVSGFLGAGKTTFINELVDKLNGTVVVLENEYAPVNVDKDILGENSDIKIWEMTEKCICCSGKSDFATNILTISNTLSPDYLIVEPTGVGYLSKVIENCRLVEYDRIKRLAAVTVLDPQMVEKYYAEYKEIFENHIRNAETIVMSKGDITNNRLALDNTLDLIASLNPDAELIKDHYSTMGEQFWLELCNKLPGGAVEIDKDIIDERNFESISIANAATSCLYELVSVLEKAIRSYYGEIVRLKGTVAVGTELLRVDISADQYMISEAEAGSKHYCVVIGESINETAIRTDLTSAENLMPNVSASIRIKI